MSPMDVDSTTPSADETPQKILVHPLAIVNMSDQYTRITTGGSRLSQDHAVTGLLFGTVNGSTLAVTDAEDVPVDQSAAAATQIELHRAVFPQHTVVGWYRVSKDDTPVDDDLIKSQQLQQHYAVAATTDDSSNGTKTPFVFALLQVNFQDDDLPFNIFTVSNNVLVAADTQLQTASAERIAVERVMRTQVSRSSSSSTADGRNAAASIVVDKAESLRQSILALQERVAILEAFLQDTVNHKVPFDCSLVREIQGLLMLAGMLPAADDNNNHRCQNNNNANYISEATTIQLLAELGNTVDKVQQYTDKVRTVQAENIVRPSRGAFMFKK